GRTAYYGRRHLCQLVAIKRLQSQNLSLAQVQERLLGLGDRELEKLAKVPAQEPIAGDNPDRPLARKQERSTDRENFWKAPPAAARMPPPHENVKPATRPEIFTLLPLTAILGVAFEACRTITAEDTAALRAAAKPLLQLLIERQLVRPDL